MIVYTHHSFVDKPPPAPKLPKVKVRKTRNPDADRSKTLKTKARKPRDLKAKRAKSRAYYWKHRDEIKIRRLRKELSK